MLCQSVMAQIDSEATPETKDLYQKLQSISLSFRDQQKVLLGQQNAFNEGRGWVKHNNRLGSPLESDMHKASGIHPAVYGLDFPEIGHWNKTAIVENIREVHKRGGIFTLSWHMPAFVNDGKGDGSFYDTTTQVVKHILPGGSHHQIFLKKLDEFVSFAIELKDVPIVFRPYHEHTGSWFWWGDKHCSRAEYIRLWHFTVNYFKSKNVHNLLYAYSPSHINDKYFEKYPGDNYVDILGVDVYFKTFLKDIPDFGLNRLGEWKKDVLTLMREADKRNKIPAITEIGNAGVHIENFWTDYFGWPLEREGVEQITSDLPERGIAYIMLWGNGNNKDPEGFYGTFPGHKQNENFNSLLSKGIFEGLP